MPVYSSLTRALAEALADVLWSIESSEDEQVSPDGAVKVLEGIAHLVGKLSSDQRNEWNDLLGTRAGAESDPADRGRGHRLRGDVRGGRRPDRPHRSHPTGWPARPTDPTTRTTRHSYEHRRPAGGHVLSFGVNEAGHPR
ncbi:hypothetical protein [Streptomyces sp. NPDC006134]|uniref:hypothetical protein n=1 Tax=Streptomyces sp. NPDC006134 TaxID=3154467 RepID=UPI0033CF5BFD